MKKIVPFNNVLDFRSDICEITAISLEHDINKTDEAISGVFHITGEYKITEGSIDTSSFSFELPFDIALGCKYNLDTLMVDIGDFRYELIDNKKLKVNIDLCIDGDEVCDEVREEPEEVKIEDNLLDDMLTEKVEVNNENKINIFSGFNEEEKYITYHVYPFTENDTLEKIMEKYQVTKEELAKYNQLDDIHVGTKLIIPTNSND